MKNTEGVFYIVYDSPKHFREAINSAQSLLDHNPDVNITIFTDQNERPISNINYERLGFYSFHPLKVKAKMMKEFPYDKNIFLDTDTKILGDISPIFNYLDDWDMALANPPDVNRDENYYSDDFFNSYKLSDRFNTGVVGFNNNKLVRFLMVRWWEVFKQVPDENISTAHGDQIYFNRILPEYIEEGLDIKVLDNKKYNVRSCVIPYINEDGLLDDVIIYHGHTDIEELKDKR